MLPLEHSAILKTFIKLLFAIKIFVLSIFEWPLKIGLTVNIFMISHVRVCIFQGLRDPHMFAASTIRRAVGLKAPFLQCVKYFHIISCVDLQGKYGYDQSELHILTSLS